MKEALLVMISCADKTQAEQLGEMLLKKKLAACTQIIPRADSLFLWPPGKNQIDYAEEAILIVKTMKDVWERLEEAVLAQHTYENPEIIGIPLPYVTKKYRAWLSSELGKIVD
jgi:periplasmic divalent cation tolerance protein